MGVLSRGRGPQRYGRWITVNDSEIGWFRGTPNRLEKHPNGQRHCVNARRQHELRRSMHRRGDLGQGEAYKAGWTPLLMSYDHDSLPVTGHDWWLFMVGAWWVNDCSLMVINCWLMVFDCWLMVALWYTHGWLCGKSGHFSVYQSGMMVDGWRMVNDG